jgi:zinc protease
MHQRPAGGRSEGFFRLTFPHRSYGPRWSAPPSAFRCGDEVQVRLPKKQAILCVGFPCASALHEDRHALALLNEYATDLAGPLFTRIREELGLAYQVGATRFHGHDTGLFTFYLATSPDQIDLAREELMKEIGKIASHGIPDDVFEPSRATLLSSLAIQQQSPAQLARQAMIDMLFGLPADHQRSLPARVRSLSGEEIRKVAAKTFRQNASVVVVLPEEKM